MKLLKALGIKHLSFEKAADKLGPAPSVTEVVIRGISDAAVVIVLFTPEEHSAFYDPITGKYGTDRGESRWQARPNVIFEAGVAIGAAREKTILATLGDVQLFSDVDGLHLVPLAKPGAIDVLYKKIKGIVGTLDPSPDWGNSADFSRVLRRRWAHFDELDELEQSLANCFVGKGEDVPVIDVVHRVLARHPDRDWRRATPRQFMESLASASRDRKLIDNTYWWLVVHGFFRFDELDDWWDEKDVWDDSVDFAIFSRRGLALIDKLKAVPRPTAP